MSQITFATQVTGLNLFFSPLFTDSMVHRDQRLSSDQIFFDSCPNVRRMPKSGLKKGLSLKIDHCSFKAI